MQLVHKLSKHRDAHVRFSDELPHQRFQVQTVQFQRMNIADCDRIEVYLGHRRTQPHLANGVANDSNETEQP